MNSNKITDYLSHSIETISSLIDSSKIIGKPMILSPSKAIVPISKVTFGIGTGSSEFASKNNKKIKKSHNEEYAEELYPYGGASLIGVNMIPEAFLLIEDGKTSIIYMEREDGLFDKILDIYKTFKK